MKLLYSQLVFEIGADETLAPLVTQRGYSTPTPSDPKAYKKSDGFEIAASRVREAPNADEAVFEITGATLCDVSLGYSHVIDDLEKVGLFRQ